MNEVVRIAVTCGEPAGIGTEAVWKALALARLEDCEITLVGPYEVWRRGFEVAGKPEGYPATILDLPELAPFDWEWGKINPASARAALASVHKAAGMALSGEVDAIVTAPLTKEGLGLAGSNAPGHTELLGELSGAAPYMFFYSDDLKVILVTTHLPISEVPGAISREKVLATIMAASASLKGDFGVASPRIGVAGLNPHAGENGRLGGEEERFIAPAVREARRLGVDAHGPLPADALFARFAEDGYDLLVAMYHDQGLAPFKMLHFNDGVNVTVNLPLVRTSPDHGTALPLAGKGEAKPDSTARALEVAAFIARRRKGMAGG